MASLFRKKKSSCNESSIASASRSKSLDPTSEAFMSVLQVPGQTLTPFFEESKRRSRPSSPRRSTSPGAVSRSRTPERPATPGRRASEMLEGGLRQLQRLYRRRDNQRSGDYLSPPPALIGRARSGSVDNGTMPASCQHSSPDFKSSTRLYTMLKPSGRRSEEAARLSPDVRRTRKCGAAKPVRHASENSAGTGSPPWSALVAPDILIHPDEEKLTSQAMNAAYQLTTIPYRRNSSEQMRPRSLSCSSDTGLDRGRLAILFRDAKGAPSVESFRSEARSVAALDEPAVYTKFCLRHKCYDTIPSSAKLVVIDTQLVVRKAFYALSNSGIRAAPLWDSALQRFVGLLTITDFIRILLQFHSSSSLDSHELERLRIATWREILATDNCPLRHISPDVSLFDAISSLVRHRYHRLPVIDPVSGDFLHLVTYKRIFHFLYHYMAELPRPSFLTRPLKDLPLGTFKTVETIRPETPLLEALQRFMARGVSSLPVTKADGRLVDLFTRFDVIGLASESVYHELDVPVSKVLRYRIGHRMATCTLKQTLAQLLDLLYAADVHRAVVIDAGQRVLGVITLSDILEAIVIKPHELVDKTRIPGLVLTPPLDNTTGADQNAVPLKSTTFSIDVDDQSMHRGNYANENPTSDSIR